jgi:intracellular septation protein A
MIATIISTMIIYRSQKRLPYAGLYVAMLTILFGYLTLMYRNPHFIQMRDTVFDATNALLLLGGLMFDYLFLKTAFQDVAPMANKGWRILTYAWISFFFFAALANEYVRHHFFLKQWVTFKTSMIAITMVFGCIAIFFSYIKQGDGKD